MDQTLTIKTALISFYVSNEQTLIFWIEEDSPDTQVYHVNLNRFEVAEAGNKLQWLFSKEQINPKRLEQTDMLWLNDISKILLGQLEYGLKKCYKLIVAPHAGLHLLPFHLLSIEGVPLAVTHSITYVANLSLYAMLISRDQQCIKSYTLPSLCISTVANEDSEQILRNFSMAPKAYAEKTGGFFLENIDATRAVLQQYAGTARTFYISCHGKYDKTDPLNSVLFLSDGETLPSKIKKNSILHELSVRDILGIKMSPELIVLDACMSGIQHISSGDEPMGFPTAFLISGVSAVIASNWIVEQNCARYFMLSMLDNWSSSGAISLGEAMQKAYSATWEKFPHPFNWGGFSLFGNDRLLFV